MFSIHCLFSGREQPGLLQYHAGRGSEFATEGERREEEIKYLIILFPQSEHFQGLKYKLSPDRCIDRIFNPD